MKVLVTGGAGYIGSHTVLELLKANYEVVVYDSLEHSSVENLNAISKMIARDVPLVKGNILDKKLLKTTITEHRPEAVIHFAGLKAAGESVKIPKEYYENNVVGSLTLLNVIKDSGIDKIVFSSTASVYGVPHKLPLSEDTPINPISAYGRTKASIEFMINDYSTAYGINAVTLRYFNAAGADESAKIGEDPSTDLNNIIPLIMEILVGRREKLLLYGDNYDTKDGTQERDYIHVTDLAIAHIAALEKLRSNGGYHVYNLGTGKLSSNKRLIELAEKVSGKKVNVEITNPRPGDPVIVYGDASLAKKDLGWTAKHDIEDIIKTAWKWHSNKKVT